MKTVLICGSRIASLNMLHFARMAAMKAYHLFTSEWQVIVGDAQGVDAEVVNTCQTWSIPYTCMGISLAPRNGAALRHYQRVVTTGSTMAERYAERDRFMVRSAHCVVCISNDELRRGNGSASGTLAVYEYANRLHRQTFLRIPDDPERVRYADLQRERLRPL